jgi:hypothetical protein
MIVPFAAKTTGIHVSSCCRSDATEWIIEAVALAFSGGFAHLPCVKAA